MRWGGINGGAKFLSWFQSHVTFFVIFSVGLGVYIQNILITSYLRQCVEYADVHEDLRLLSYGLVKFRSYGRYDINGFQFRSTQFEAFRPVAATTNTRVVMRAIDAQGWETNYYRIINNILEFNFAENKELKVIFFDCDCFDNNHVTQQNQFGMVEVKCNKQL
jgi:hypothetical protein